MIAARKSASRTTSRLRWVLTQILPGRSAVLPHRLQILILSYEVQEAGTGANLDVNDFEATVTFHAPYDSYNYSYTTSAWADGQLPYAAPPSYYRD